MEYLWVVNTLNNLNSSNVSKPYPHLHVETVSQVALCMLVLIMIVGLFGNTLIIYIFCTNRSMRSEANKYILSLAIGDLLVLIFCIPTTAIVYTHDTWPFDETTCKFSEFMRILSMGISVFTLTAISIVKYYAIKYPLRSYNRERRKLKVSSIVICGIWIFSIILAIPFWDFAFVRVIDEDEVGSFKVCYPHPTEFGETYPQVIVLSSFCVFYLIPLCIMMWFYVIMAIHLLRSITDFPGECAAQIRRVQERKKVVIMFFLMAMIFAVCFLPEHLYLIWFYFNPGPTEDFDAFWFIFRTIGFLLGFINSCANPIALLCMSNEFRQYFCKYIFCCLRKQSGASLRTVEIPRIVVQGVAAEEVL